jgi:hypothetical protein
VEALSERARETWRRAIGRPSPVHAIGADQASADALSLRLVDALGIGAAGHQTSLRRDVTATLQEARVDLPLEQADDRAGDKHHRECDQSYPNDPPNSHTSGRRGKPLAGLPQDPHHNAGHESRTANDDEQVSGPDNRIRNHRLDGHGPMVRAASSQR